MALDADALVARLGNPIELWAALKERVQADASQSFTDVQDEWLGLMWALDGFRVARVDPPGSGKDLEALNRDKGNWFAELIAFLLQNRTAQHVGARTRVQGFSQTHQIDVAWPARKRDVLVCAETKVTGGPAVEKQPARGAMSDWTNRRKELKFAATDLKLYRRQRETAIEHWDEWRTDAPPKTYFLWAARLRTTGKSPDTIEKMAKEAQALINTYLDGAGIFAWREDDGAYRAVSHTQAERVTNLDDVLYRIATVIKKLAGPTGKPPEPVVPKKPAVDTEDLAPDAD